MDKIYPAIMKVMEEIGVIGKTRKNPQQGYSFRGIDDVLNNLQPALIRAKVFVVPRMMEVHREEKPTKQGGVLNYTTVKAEFDFCSAEDGSKVTASTYGEGMDSSDKSTNKAMSAALKYAIIQTFAIPTEELIDSERDHLEPAVEYISAESISNINALLKETSSDTLAFLKYIGAESVEKIPVSHYPKALIALQNKKKAATKRQPGDDDK
jgi:hypothetical protein